MFDKHKERAGTVTTWKLLTFLPVPKLAKLLYITHEEFDCRANILNFSSMSLLALVFKEAGQVEWWKRVFSVNNKLVAECAAVGKQIAYKDQKKMFASKTADYSFSK